MLILLIVIRCGDLVYQIMLWWVISLLFLSVGTGLMLCYLIIVE